MNALCAKGCPPIVRALIRARADVDAVDIKGQTPLHHAAKSPDGLSVLRILLVAGARGDIPDEDGLDALGTALETALAALRAFPRTSDKGRALDAQATLILATIAAAGGLACAAGSSGVDAHRRLQAATCSSYSEVTVAANAVEAACCPPGSSFAVSGCQMTAEMECTKACSTPFLDFVNGPCLAAINLAP